jgi:hypothetical protein
MREKENLNPKDMKCYLLYVDDVVESVFLSKFTAIRALLAEKDKVQSEGYDVGTTIWNNCIEVFAYGINNPIVRLREKPLVG